MIKDQVATQSSFLILKKDCTTACSCPKSELKFSNMCEECISLVCINVVEMYDLEDKGDTSRLLFDFEKSCSYEIF